MEQDCPPYLTTYRGVEEGTFRLLELFAREKIPATFFTTGDVAERYPSIIKQIVDLGHELGCHGYSHRRFDQMDFSLAAEEIKRSTALLRKFATVISFRAPNLEFPPACLSLLEKEGYQLDSSEAKYKWTHRLRSKPLTSLTRIPASVTSSVLRLPKTVRTFWMGRLKSPVVLFVHPWEFVDFRNDRRLRLDCRFKTGKIALECLSENIHWFKKRDFEFLKMRDLLSLHQGSR